MVCYGITFCFRPHTYRPWYDTACHIWSFLKWMHYTTESSGPFLPFKTLNIMKIFTDIVTTWSEKHCICDCKFTYRNCLAWRMLSSLNLCNINFETWCILIHLKNIYQNYFLSIYIFIYIKYMIYYFIIIFIYLLIYFDYL